MSRTRLQSNHAPDAQDNAFDVCQLVIEKPEKQRTGQKFLLGGITLLFWGAWSFLWTPLVNTLGWAFGFYSFYEHLVVLRGWQGLLRLLPIYALIVQFLAGGLILWALLNWVRFRNRERRQAMRDVSQDDLAVWQAQPSEHVAGWQQVKRLVVHHDANGKLVEVDTGTP